MFIFRISSRNVLLTWATPLHDNHAPIYNYRIFVRYVWCRKVHIGHIIYRYITTGYLSGMYNCMKQYSTQCTVLFTNIQLQNICQLCVCLKQYSTQCTILFTVMCQLCTIKSTICTVNRTPQLSPTFKCSLYKISKYTMIHVKYHCEEVVQ